MTLTALFSQMPWLTLLLALPLVGAILCMLADPEERTSHGLALVTTGLVFAIAVGLFVVYSNGGGGWLLQEDAAWITRYGIRYSLGMDGISLVMVLLTSFLLVIAALAAWPVRRYAPQFLGLLLLLETGLLGIFLAVDLVLFYLFWEIMLIPLFIMIGLWGGEQRRQAAIKFFLYALAGSLAMLIALISLYLLHGDQTGNYTFLLTELVNTELSLTQELWLFAGFMLAFAIKTPLVPFHTWLPDAHAESPESGVVDLTGLLIKTGIFGMIRIAFPLFPAATHQVLPLLGVLALVSLFHAAWGAYRQQDIKRLFAYSSISHVGLILLGLAAWQVTALEGSILLMLTNAVATGALFLLVAMIRQRTGTCQLGELSGLWGQAPNLSALFLLFALSSLGLPGLANFAGEILVLIGTFQTHPVWASLAMVAVVFAAAYILRLVQKVIWGPDCGARLLHDLTPREWLILAPLAILVIWLGLYPAPFLTPLHEPVQLLLGGLP